MQTTEIIRTMSTLQNPKAIIKHLMNEAAAPYEHDTAVAILEAIAAAVKAADNDDRHADVAIPTAAAEAAAQVKAAHPEVDADRLQGEIALIIAGCAAAVFRASAEELEALQAAAA